MEEISDGGGWFGGWEGGDGCVCFWMGAVMLDMDFGLSGSTYLCRMVRKRKRMIAGLGGRRRRRRDGRRRQVLVEGFMIGCKN